MSEVDGKLTKLPEWRELFDVAQTWEYGSTHSHEECAAIMQLRPQGGAYYSNVGRCKKELLDKSNRILESVPKLGYRIALPNEHVKRANGNVKFAARRIEKAAKILIQTADDLLTPDEKNIHDRYSQRFYRVYGPIATERAQLRRIAAGKEPIKEIDG